MKNGIIKNEKWESGIQNTLYIVLLCLLLLALLHAFKIEPLAVIQSSEKQIASSEFWKLESQETADGVTDTYSCRIADVTEGETVLSLKSYNADIDVFLDGESIYAYHDKKGEHGVCWKWIELPEDANGKELTLQVSHSRTWKKQVDLRNILIGDKNAIFLRILKEDVFALIIGSMNILLGLMMYFATWLIRERLLRNVRKGLYYLATFIVLSGEWLITDSTVLQFVTGRTAVISLISFSCFMLMPYFLLRFIRKMMVYQTPGLMILAHLYLVNITVCIFLHLLHVVTLRQTLPITHILIFVSSILMIREGLREVERNHNKEMKIILLGMASMMLFLVIALIIFYMNTNLNYAVFYGIGIVVFELALVNAVFSRANYYLDNSAQTEEYREIAYKDSMTQLWNRLAFTKQQERGSRSENQSYIVLDINNLKKVNDMQGHLAGDELIMDAAKCIIDAFDELGRCFRIGGDEFAVISGTTAEEEIQEAIGKLEKACRNVNRDRRIPVEIAYGYAIRRDETVSAQELFDEADVRMYEKKLEMKAKRNG